jgi:hypothetical protein
VHKDDRTEAITAAQDLVDKEVAKPERQEQFPGLTDLQVRST